MNATVQSPHRVLGNVEGFLSLACTLLVLCYPVTPASRFHLPYCLILAWAAGIGLGISGWRFGSSGARYAGAVSIVLLVLLLVVLILTDGVGNWAAVQRYWSSVW